MREDNRPLLGRRLRNHVQSVTASGQRLAVDLDVVAHRQDGVLVGASSLRRLLRGSEARTRHSPWHQTSPDLAAAVLAIGAQADFEQALAFANDTSYGLSAYVFTRDLKRLMRLPSELRFGEIYFNRANGEQVHAYHSGWGHSGVGGEDGKYGFSAYFKKQTMYVNWGD